MARKGGWSHINYKETKGLKVASGQTVKTGTILTRQADKWKAGLNVGGNAALYALVAGRVYFTHRRATYRTKKTATVINIEKLEPKKSDSHK